MADASASTMPSGQQNYVALQSQTAEETTVSTPTSSRSTTGGSEKHTEGNLSVNSHPPSDTDVPRKKTAYVESVDTSSSDEDFNRTSVSGNLQFSASVSPKVPWRRGGIWHVRSGNQRDGVHKRRSAASTGSGGRPQPEFIADTDSDTDSTESVMEFHPSLYDDDFDDMDSEFGMGAWREFLHIDNDDRERAHGPPEEPLYPQGLLVETECYVCFEETELRRRLCCDFPVCDKCLESYLMVQVLQANVNIECLNINCNSYIHRNEISARLPPKFKMKFYKFLIDANVDPTVKTCPRCSCGLQVDKAALKKRKVIKNGLHVTCKRCNLDWCFTCHAPLHKGMTCKAYRKGDVLLKEWAREFHYGQLNAQQCPKCKIFIQRSLGCDHMLCTRCSTNFCYKCGECYRGVKLLGNHFSRYSPFGCRYLFLPDAPHLRRLIRGAVLGGKLLGGLVLSGFVVVAGACMLGVSVVALPAWGGYKLHKRRRYRQRMRAKMKYTKQNLALRNLQAKKAADISVPSLPLPPPLDSSDSMADDSSDEMRDRVMVGLELPDSQRVEVLVHQTVSSSSDQEEGGGACGGGGGGGTTSTTTTTMKEVVTDSAVIVTDVQEVVNESGYTTVVTNVHAKSKDSVLHAPASAPEGADGSDEEEEYYSDDGHSHQGSRKSECRSLSSVKHAATPGKESDRQSGSDRKLAGDCDEADKLSVSVAKVIGGAGDSCCDETDKLSVSVAKVIGGGNDDAHSLKSKQHNKTADRKDRDTESTQEKKGEDKEPSTVKEKKEKKGEDKEPSTVKEKKAEDKEPSTVKEKKEKKAEDKEPSTVKEKKEKKAEDKEPSTVKEKKEKKAEDKEPSTVKEKKEKKAEDKEPSTVKEKKEKPSEYTGKSDKRQTESGSCTEKEKEKVTEGWEKSEKKPEKDSWPGKPMDQKDGDELSKESTNGCFGNIFSKKITVIQIGSKRSTDTPPDTQKPANNCYKSSTWEKSRGGKTSQRKHKTSMDIQDLSHFKEKLPLQLSDVYTKPAYDKGVLLQDFVVLAPPGDFSSERVKGDEDSLSLASASSAGDARSGKEGEKGGEGSSCCCLSASDSFRGSNLSCDIVTYL